MRRKVLVVLGVVALVLAAFVGFNAAPASAHNQDNYTTYYCAKHRTNGYFTVTHSVYYYLDVDEAGIYCREAFFSVQNQYWVHVRLPLSSNSSWMPWERQECKPTGPFPCFEP